MSITYAGIPLNTTADPSKLAPGMVAPQDWMEAVHPPTDTLHWTARMWPGVNSTRFGFYGFDWPPAPRIGSLYWPWSASRWTVGYFFATEERTEAIRAVTQGGGFHAEPLVLSDGRGPDFPGITTDLFMLPARPLMQTDGSAANRKLNLITLVDERFYWWERAEVVTVSGSTSWEELYAAIGTALGITIVVDTIPEAYLAPALGFTAQYESLPLLLDAVAFSVGQRLVRKYNGTILAQNVSSARLSVLNDLIQSRDKLAGGLLALNA